MPADKRVAAIAGLGALGAAGVVAYAMSKKPVATNQQFLRPLRAADLELQPDQSEQTIPPHLRLATITWDNPHQIALVPAGSSVVIGAQYANGGIGYMTLLGTLWIPAGPNGDLFYYELVADGQLVDRIFRIIGAGSSVSVTTGIPSPQRYDPPITFNKQLIMTCFNKDTIPHSAEIYLGGYTKRYVPF